MAKYDPKKIKEYDDEFERNMESIEQAQKRIDQKNKKSKTLQMYKQSMENSLAEQADANELFGIVGSNDNYK